MRFFELAKKKLISPDHCSRLGKTLRARVFVKPKLNGFEPKVASLHLTALARPKDSPHHPGDGARAFARLLT